MEYLHLAHLSEQFRNRPNVIGQVRFHRRGDPESSMDAAEVVIGEVERDCEPEVFPLLGKAQCKTSQPLDLRPHGQIRSLDVAGRDHGRIGIANHCMLLAADTFRRRVAFLGFGVFGVLLDEHCVVNAVAQVESIALR